MKAPRYASTRTLFLLAELTSILVVTVAPELIMNDSASLNSKSSENCVAVVGVPNTKFGETVATFVIPL